MPNPNDPVGDPKCVWEWLGVMPWEPYSNDCTGEDTCPAPQNPGSIIGELETTACEMHD